MATNCRINNWITSDDDAYFEDACEACVGDSIYPIEGEFYCVMHFPSQNKIAEFRAALKQKTDKNDFNFCCVYFPEKTTFGRESSSFSKSEQLTYKKVVFGVQRSAMMYFSLTSTFNTLSLKTQYLKVMLILIYRGSICMDAHSIL